MDIFLLLPPLLCRQHSNYETCSININLAIMTLFLSLCTTAMYCCLFLQMYFLQDALDALCVCQIP